MLKSESKQIILSILGISILIIAFVGISYAAFHSVLSGEKNSVATGTISLQFSDNSESISISNAMPISDDEGKSLTGNGNVYDFSVYTILSKNTTINYEISLEKININTPNLDNENVRFYLQNQEGDTFVDTPITTVPQSFIPLVEDSFLGTKKGNMVIFSGTFSNTTDSDRELNQKFRLRIWVGKDTIIDSISREFQVKLNVTAKAI